MIIAGRCTFSSPGAAGLHRVGPRADAARARATASRSSTGCTSATRSPRAQRALRREAAGRARRRPRLRPRAPQVGRRGGGPLGHLERSVVRARAGAHAQRERRRRQAPLRCRRGEPGCGATCTRRRAACTGTARGWGSARRARATRCRSTRAPRPTWRTSLLGAKGPEVCLLRLATVFGLSPRMRFDLAINVMTKNAYVARRIMVDGGGRQWRPFVHVRDVARAFEPALTGRGREGRRPGVQRRVRRRATCRS